MALSRNVVVAEQDFNPEFFPLGPSWFQPSGPVNALRSRAPVLGAMGDTLPQPRC